MPGLKNSQPGLLAPSIHSLLEMLRMLLLCAAGFGLCLGQVLKPRIDSLRPGPCPEFVPKTDFEVPPYLGKWLEIARFYNEDQEGQVCNYAEYSDNGDGTVGVHNVGLEYGNYTEIFGYAETTDVPGALVLHLDGVPERGTYNVLDTDYVTYTSVYKCINIIGGFHSDHAWVLGRHILTNEEFDIALEAFTRWGIGLASFFFTPQDDCPGLS